MTVEDRPPRTSGVSHLPPEECAAAFRQRYLEGRTPWDWGRPNSELLRVADEGGLPGRQFLELGCGTGTNAVAHARRGCSGTAVDLVDVVVDNARSKAKAAGVRVGFRVGDLTKLDLGGPYESICDVGVCHCMRNRDLAGFLATMKRVPRQGTRWLTRAGNAKETLAEGPPVVTEQEFRKELEPLFRILEAREFRFDLGPAFQPLGWSVRMERRSGRVRRDPSWTVSSQPGVHARGFRWCHGAIARSKKIASATGWDQKGGTRRRPSS